MNTFDLNRFKWREDDQVSGRFIREPVGGELIENVWNMIHHGEQNLFLGIYAAVSKPHSPHDFTALACEAWKSLRYETPIIALKVLHVSEPGKPLPRPYMVYDVANSSMEVDDWAKETVILEEGHKDLDDLRHAVGQDPLPPKDLVFQTYLYILPFSTTSFGLLIRTSHVPFDGPGLKIVGTKLLTHLANYISDPKYRETQCAQMKWGSESSNLLPGVLDIIQSYKPSVKDDKGNIVRPEVQGEVRDGPIFDKTFNEVMQGLVKGSAAAHPFKSIIHPPFDIEKQKPITRRLYHTFSLEESARIKAAGEPTPSKPEKLTVNHLLHGSVSLLPIFDNPPEKSSEAVVFYYGLVDSRRKLIQKYRGTYDYPGYCLAMSAIQVPVALYFQFPSDSKRELVLEYAKAIRKEYQKQADLPSHLSVSGLQVETMMQAPPPPPWCGPWYAGDGRGSVHLTPNYEVNGNKVIGITDFFIALNKCDPGPFFRATEWNGHIMLSVDFNELAVETKTVKHWMDMWVDLLLSL